MASTPPSPAFLAAFRERADASGTMTFAQFMDLALYDPAIGYYRQRRQRVGYAAGTDFFTASTSGPVFGELVLAACESILGPDQLPAMTFVEIGAEAPGGILQGVNHRFGVVRTLPVGEPLTLDGACVVFSNELFDAQPFRRFVRRDGRWRELGVKLAEEGLSEIEVPGAAPELLPNHAPEGYVIDAPLAAAGLAGAIARQPWHGLFLAFDYGKSWDELREHCPQGTARAYHHHTQSNDLLAHPGDQDLTCHVCWDWISATLMRHGFQAAELDSQEAFFVRHASSYIARVSEADASRFSRRKLSLLQLLSPGQLGQKFQVLSARRGV